MNIGNTFMNAVASRSGQHILYNTNGILVLCRWRWLFHVNCYHTVRNLICDALLKMIIERNDLSKFCRFRVNNFDIKRYMEFIDVNVMRSIESDELIKCLDECMEFKEMPANDLYSQVRNYYSYGCYI